MLRTSSVFPFSPGQARALACLLPILLTPALAEPLAIVNGGFETGSDGQSSLSPIAGWTDSGTSAGFWLQDGSGGGSFPQDPSEPQAGSLYLTANRLAGGAGAQPSSSTLSQVVAIPSGDLPLVQSGNAELSLVFFYQDTDTNDTGTVSTEFLDASSQVVGTASSGALSNVAPNGTSYSPSTAPWTEVTLGSAVPSSAVSVRIRIQTIRTGGSATNVHFDSFSATIAPQGPPPESPYRSTTPWVAYDGSALPVTPAGSYFAPRFMPITETPEAGSLMIAGDGQGAPIHYSDGDAAVVRIAAEALADDVERVTGIVPVVSTDAPAAAEVILIGTVGKSPLIDTLVSTGRIDVSAIAGKWEAYTAAVVENPQPGVDRALVIAGSDRRGTAFGVFALSESMGVSPWYFWGDVPTRQKSALHVAGSHTQPSPGVKYRGIFLNDEDWGLQPWAAQTFEPEVGNIGPKTYATIFELLLRLHANVIWPAMHEFPVETTPFYLVPGNKQAADDHAIVISTSHHEPMLTNSHEYDEGVLGPYNYWTNRSNIYDFWEQRVEETADCENIYTMGMRGRTDAGMLAPAGTTNAQKAEKIETEIIPDQRQMISDHVNGDASEIPQIFIPYKETLVQYQSGLDLPDDVTIVWPDDNHGYIRQLSTAAERARSGGSGVYYHLSYWGVPTSYLWFCSTPPGMTRSEMMKAWDFGADKIWLVNVGDLKPHEIGTEFFLRLASNPEAFREFDQNAWFTQWAARNFEPSQASAIADVLEDYFRLNIVKRPEHLNRTSSGFSFTDNGDEAAKRLAAFSQLTADAEGIYNQLPADQKPAFYEMVLFPARACYQVNRRNLQAERSRLWATQNRANTAAPAAEAQAAHAALLAELDFYNGVNAGGKWDKMFNPMPIAQLPGWAQETQNPFIMPSLGSYSPPGPASLGVAIEGSATQLADGVRGELPVFSGIAEPVRFIDVFNLGTSAMTWTATASDPWITLSQTGGSADARIQVGIDWETAPRGHAVPGTITISGADAQRTVGLRVFHPLGLDPGALPEAVENNGVVVIEAEDFTSRSDAGDGTGWRRQDQATASDDGMTIQPVTAASLNAASLPADAPVLTYQFHAFRTGPVRIRTQCLPTHRITSDHLGLRYAISLNGGTPQVIDVNAAEYSSAWNANTLRAASIGVSKHVITTAGPQTIEIRMVDAGVVLDKLTVEIASGEFEAEDLGVDDTNTSVVPFTDPPASEGAGLHIQSTAANRYATLVLPDIAAGDYQLTVRVKKWSSRGIVQMAVSESPTGPFTNIGSTYDLYSSSELYTDLETLEVSFNISGPKYLRFTAVGKNASSSNYWILLDKIALKPVASLGDQPIRNWRTSFFGSSENFGLGADLADPDGDLIPNLIEYATGSYPTVPNASPVSTEWSADHLVIVFSRARDATDITYRVLAGDELPPTSPIWSSETVPYPGGDAPYVITTVTDPQSVGESDRRFLVLEVQRP
ncbi:hypothetical protein HNR46_003695 [Haloferula luteola]|uniref:Gylcosyl hydrolase 115 C-terminal domain-containing protein n=1 Tax=Haloferula luteola TaxID=595692 RepID=A0A840VD42_9BACT|nr:glycosyl hydrolase 115 family protein [Haloferula luteola]MBB5353434.1 hypothetical protein [Haloferula luteola]